MGVHPARGVEGGIEEGGGGAGAGRMAVGDGQAENIWDC